ncbi:Polyamine aminopropyltransferase [uncultured archaeon]|nr:Polyamine aminopropyltransferase [uncultured archaeon]
MVLELVGSRLIAPFFGNNLFAWTSIIGVIMAALAAGYYWGGRAADKNPSLERLSLYIIYAAVYLVALPRLTTVIYPAGVFLGIKYGALLSALILLAVPSFFLGTVSPYAVKVSAKKMDKLGSSAGDLYALSTVGSIVGVFLSGFVLIPTFSLNSIIYGLALTCLYAAYCANPVKKKIIPLAIILFASAVLIAVMSMKTTSSALFFPNYSVIYERDTPYNHVAVLDSPNGSRRVLSFGIGEQTAIDTKTGESLNHYTHFIDLSLLLKPTAPKTLFLGGGGSAMPTSFHRRFPTMKIDVVDIDPEVNKAAQKYFNATPDENLRFHDEDARMFLRKTDEKYDIVVWDLFSDGGSIPFHTDTQEYFNELSTHLTDDGVLAINIISAVEGPASGILTANVKTLKTILPNVYVFPIDFIPARPQNVIVIATKQKNNYDLNDWLKKASEQATTPTGNLTIYALSLRTNPLDLDNAPILTDQNSPHDALMSEVLTSYRQEMPKTCFSVGICIDTEIVKTPEKQQLGLMNRGPYWWMNHETGMLFPMNNPTTGPFWMKNMRMPIDIIWIGENSRVVGITSEAQPCEKEPCQLYYPPAPYKWALEAPPGYAKKHNLQEGAQIQLPDQN